MKIFKSKFDKELEILLRMWWRQIWVLSNFEEKDFVEFMKYHLKEYDELKKRNGKEILKDVDEIKNRGIGMGFIITSFPMTILSIAMISFYYDILTLTSLFINLLLFVIGIILLVKTKKWYR